MKSLASLVLFAMLISCEKKEVVPVLDLNGTYMGRAVGYAQPFNFDMETTWTVTHVGNEFKASITYGTNQAFNVPDYEGEVFGDSVIMGYLLPVGYSPISQLYTNGVILKGGDSLTFESDTGIPYVRVKYYLKREE